MIYIITKEKGQRYYLRYRPHILTGHAPYRQRESVLSPVTDQIRENADIFCKSNCEYIGDDTPQSPAPIGHGLPVQLPIRHRTLEPALPAAGFGLGATALSWERSSSKAETHSGTETENTNSRENVSNVLVMC